MSATSMIAAGVLLAFALIVLVVGFAHGHRRDEEAREAIERARSLLDERASERWDSWFSRWFSGVVVLISSLF